MSHSPPFRVIGIDPSLRSTGFAVIEQNGRARRVLEFGRIKNGDRLPMTGCLVAIHAEIARLIGEHRPDCAAIEGVIYVQSFRTAITLGSARGSALLALAAAALPIYEYAPRRVKQAIVGRGGAAKNQVGFMVRAMLGLTETPPEDAADALAICLTHLQAHESAGAGAARLTAI